MAREVFVANGAADRVTLVEGHPAHVELPQRADVLVSEIIGLGPRGERVRETTRDAVERMLRPGARLIPSSLDLFAVPVTLPDAVKDVWRFTTPNAERWGQWYDMDFSPLVVASERSVTAMTAPPKRLHEWTALADAVPVFRQDLRAIDEFSFTSQHSFVATGTGRIDAVALWFEIELAPGIAISTDPRARRPDNSWDHRVWGLRTPLDVEAGDQLAITYRYQTDGSPLEIRLVG